MARQWRARCIAFGGLRVDDAIAAAILQVVEPGAIAAAFEAIVKLGQGADLLETRGWDDRASGVIEV